MKTLSAIGKISGFTLIEVLVVIALIVVLVVMMVPALDHPHTSRGPSCMSNQKQICLGLIMSQGDNDGKFPWQRSTATNGTMELITNGQAASQFLALADYLKSFCCYVCPVDAGKTAATNYDHFTGQNISYLVNVDATTNTAATILTGDRRLIVNGDPVTPGLLYYKNTSDLRWSRGLHGTGERTDGVMGFADGHAEIVKTTNLNGVFHRQGLVSDRLVVP